mgnify:CR=1 FL=1
MRSAWGPAVARPARLSPAASVRQRRQVVRRVERDHALQDAVAQGVAAAEPPVLVQAGGEEGGLDRAHRVEPAEAQAPQDLERGVRDPERRARRTDHQEDGRSAALQRQAMLAELPKRVKALELQLRAGTKARSRVSATGYGRYWAGVGWGRWGGPPRAGEGDRGANISTPTS